VAHLASYPVGIRGSFSWGKEAGIVKLTIHLHLTPRPKMHGAIRPHPQHASMAWRSVRKRTGTLIPRRTNKKTFCTRLVTGSEWFETKRFTIFNSFQLFFRLFHQERPKILERNGI
jgi:hypothetical protein